MRSTQGVASTRVPATPCGFCGSELPSDHFSDFSTGSVESPTIFTPRPSNYGLMLSMQPSSVVHTGVNARGCEKSTAQPSPIQSWKHGVCRVLAGTGAVRETQPMSTATTVVDALAEAIVAQDLARATALLDPEIDFRAMTPNRIWEPDGPAGVADVLREWFEDPDEELAAVAQSVWIEDTVRVGRISDADGLHVFEQQAYVRERDSRIAWMRVICSGWIPLGGIPA
jgi:hypothetical protein